MRRQKWGKIYEYYNRRLPLKKVQSQVFSVENAFCEHYGNKPEKRGFAIRVFKTPTRKCQNGHLLGQSKMSKKWGYNYPSSIFAIGRYKRKSSFRIKNLRFKRNIFG